MPGKLCGFRITKHPNLNIPIVTYCRRNYTTRVGYTTGEDKRTPSGKREKEAKAKPGNWPKIASGEEALKLQYASRLVPA